MVVAYTPTPSAATMEAYARRASRAQENVKKTEWFIEEVSDKVRLTVQHRVRLATDYLRDKIVRNISRPVTKTRITGVSGRSYTRVTDRSKPGEFPKADTTLLMKTIFSDHMKVSEGVYDGVVGTPLDYGVILELVKDRSFMVRTLHEERDKITKILTGPIT